MVREAEVAGFIEGDKMDVGVRHVDADNGLPYFDAGAYFFQSPGHLAAEEVQLGEEFVVEVEDLVDFFLGDAEHVAAHDGIDIEECQAMLGFGDAVARDLAGHYLAEDTCHINVRFW